MAELLGPYLSEQVQTHALDFECGRLFCVPECLDPGLPGIRDIVKI